MHKSGRLYWSGYVLYDRDALDTEVEVEVGAKMTG
jgi:hypothetical protein